MRHFIATDRKGTLNSIRKTSAPAELSISDREDYSKSSVSSRSITRTSCPQVTSVFPHPDLCPRYENNLIIHSLIPLHRILEIQFPTPHNIPHIKDLEYKIRAIVF